jgi:hypothetical protein
MKLMEDMDRRVGSSFLVIVSIAYLPNAALILFVLRRLFTGDTLSARYGFVIGLSL